jgi:hypothetical protein
MQETGKGDEQQYQGARETLEMKRREKQRTFKLRMSRSDITYETIIGVNQCLDTISIASYTTAYLKLQMQKYITDRLSHPVKGKECCCVCHLAETFCSKDREAPRISSSG